MLDRVGIVVRRALLQLVYQFQTSLFLDNSTGVVAILGSFLLWPSSSFNGNLHIGQSTLVPVLTVTRPQWILKKLQVLTKTTCQTYIKLSNDFIFFFLFLLIYLNISESLLHLFVHHFLAKVNKSIMTTKIFR